MANKKGVVMFYDILEQLEDFNDKDFREIIEAVINYDKNGILPQFDGEKKIAFKFIKVDIDKNNEEYNKKCEQNRLNIAKRWNKENTTEYDRIQPNIDIDKDIDKDLDIDKENNIKEKPLQSNSHSTSKETKHKYGEYKNVLLTDSEVARLTDEYGTEKTEQAITYLDEYIEMKGYKAKSHNLAIRKWVFDAIKEKQTKQPPKQEAQNFTPREYEKNDYSSFYADLYNIEI